MLVLGRNASQVEGTASTRALRQECANMREEEDHFGWSGVSQGKGSG